MLKIINLHEFFKLAYLTVFFFSVHLFVCSQTILFTGIIKDEQTLKPILNVNIKVYGSALGTSTDQAGNFSLKVNKIPTTLIFTCVGYEDASYSITVFPKKPVEFQLRQKSYLLREVGISSKNYSYMFKDQDYSVLDYEIMGDNLVVLVFRYQLKQSELILLSRDGDTLAISPLPEIPPAKLFKDFLANVHYISKDANAYQFLFNEPDDRIEFYHPKSEDSLQAYLKPFLFKIADRLYFQETLAAGFGTAFGFYEIGKGKKYLRRVINTKKISEYGDDQVFYQNWNVIVPTEHYFYNPSEYDEPVDFDFTQGYSSSTHFEENEARAYRFEFYKTIYPVIKTGEDDIAFFNFITDTLELMNESGKRKSAVQVTFHKESESKADTGSSIRLSASNWRWGCVMIVDDFSRDVYTIFRRNGMVKVQNVDLETGKLKAGTVLPFAFPEKIEIYRGEAYFLVKSDGSNGKWKLVKCKLQ
jgi:hypothetical protein